MGEETVTIHHVGIAVESLAEARRFYEALGMVCEGEEEVPDQGVRAAFFPAGGPRLELLESTDPDGPVARFIRKRGPGLHHLCLAVPDVAEALAELDRMGFTLIDRVPRTGAGGKRVAFVHPKSASGVLLELTE